MILKQNDITGLILAGGQSRRFGRDKAHYLVDGRPMVAHVFAAIQPLVAEMLVSVRSPEDHLGIAARPVLDCQPGMGPLAGLQAGFVASRTPWLLAVACDMPFLTSDVLQALVAAYHGTLEAVAAKTPDGRLQPLCALYRSSILPHVEDALAAGTLSLHALFSRLDTTLTVDVPFEPLRNINRLGDLSTAAALGPNVRDVAAASTGHDIRLSFPLHSLYPAR